jgi:hypothetical protein
MLFTGWDYYRIVTYVPQVHYLLDGRDYSP